MDRRTRNGLVWGAAAGSAAALLWRSRARRMALAAQIEALTQAAVEGLGAPAVSTFVDGEGVRLHAVVAGPEDGPLVVLLHGFPECWYSWRRQIPPLVGQGCRVVAPDQRGYNLSDKPREIESYAIDTLTADVLALMRALGRERAVIVGHDWGGMVAWRLAMDHPEAVDRLVVMNSPHPKALAREMHRGWAQRLRSSYMTFFQAPWLPEALLTLYPRGSAWLAFRRATVRPGAFSDPELEVMAAALAQPGAMRGMLNWYRAAFRYRPARRTQAIETPTLLIWGEDDPFLGKALTCGLEKWVPHLRVHHIPGCGHWVQNEAAEQVNQQMLAFLAGPT